MKAANQEEIKEIFLRYFTSSCSEEELYFLNTWILDNKNDAELSRLIEEFLIVDNLPGSVYLENQDEVIWGQICQKIDVQNILRKNENPQPKVKRSLLKRYNVVGIAATVSILIISAVISWFYLNSYLEANEKLGDQITINKKETHLGEKLTVQLPDGSVVKLNSSSRLEYGSDFNISERKLILTGEAFFDVAKNEKRPFTVITGNIETTVVGTSFNVDFYSKETTKIAVASGIVTVRDKLNEKNSIRLEKDEMTIIEKKDLHWSKSSFDYDKILGWKDGTIVIENERFQEILNRLEKWYGVNFTISGKPKDDILYNAKYENEPLDRILMGLSFTYGFKYKIKGNEVNISF